MPSKWHTTAAKQKAEKTAVFAADKQDHGHCIEGDGEERGLLNAGSKVMR